MPDPPLSVRVTAVILAKVENPPIPLCNVSRSAISLAAKAVTAAEVTCSVVASLIVFRSAAVASVASALSIVIVQECASAFSPSGVRNSVKEATLVPLAIVAVTFPSVSAAIVFAFATLTPTVLSTVTS